MKTKKSERANFQDYLSAAEALAYLEETAYQAVDELNPILTDTEVHQFKSAVVYKIQRTSSKFLLKAYEALPPDEAGQVERIIYGRLYKIAQNRRRNTENTETY